MGNKKNASNQPDPSEQRKGITQKVESIVIEDSLESSSISIDPPVEFLGPDDIGGKPPLFRYTHPNENGRITRVKVSGPKEHTFDMGIRSIKLGLGNGTPPVIIRDGSLTIDTPILFDHIEGSGVYKRQGVGIIQSHVEIELEGSLEIITKVVSVTMEYTIDLVIEQKSE